MFGKMRFLTYHANFKNADLRGSLGKKHFTTYHAFSQNAKLRGKSADIISAQARARRPGSGFITQKKPGPGASRSRTSKRRQNSPQTIGLRYMINIRRSIAIPFHPRAHRPRYAARDVEGLAVALLQQLSAEMSDETADDDGGGVDDGSKPDHTITFYSAARIGRGFQFRVGSVPVARK